jgi:hypothetical protein
MATTCSSVAAPSPMLSSSGGRIPTTAKIQPSFQSTSCSQICCLWTSSGKPVCTISRSLQTSLRNLTKEFARNWSTCGSRAFLCQVPSSSSWRSARHSSGCSYYTWSSPPTQVFEESCGAGVILQSSFCCSNFSGRLQITRREEGGGRKRHAGKIQAYVRLDPGGGGGRGPNGDNNGIGRVVFNLALAGGLTYLTVTGKLGWVFDAFISLWLLVILVPIVSIVAFLWFADREIVSGSCPNCGNAFQVLEFTVKDEQQFCPYCSQPFKFCRLSKSFWRFWAAQINSS